MSESFVIREQSRAGHHELTIEGELDLAAAYDLEAALSRICEGGATQIVLDLRGVSFMDSMGMRSLLTARDLCEGHGVELGMIPNPALHKIFEVTGLVDALPWRPAVD